MEAELFHADGHTDMMKLIVAFRNFANVPKRFCETDIYVSVHACVHFSTAVLNKRNLRLPLQEPCPQRHSAISQNT